ncbi:MAG: hypothetical protein AAGA67_07740 [Cyanobacteria bacterium P01_F01_bin.153]
MAHPIASVIANLSRNWLPRRDGTMKETAAKIWPRRDYGTDYPFTLMTIHQSGFLNREDRLAL